MKSRKFFSALLIFAFAFLTFTTGEAAMLRKGKISSSTAQTPQLNRPVLPKTGDIAVIVEGPDPQHNAIAEAMIIEELTSNGYRVVDEARMKRIRAAAARAQAARYALEGNVEGLLKINGTYNATATIVASVRAGFPEPNEFRLYTGTASAAMVAVTSGGVKLGGKTSQGKAVGYTVDEARVNAITGAVRHGLSLML